MLGLHLLLLLLKLLVHCGRVGVLLMLWRLHGLWIGR
jgi:hypothetical protein